MKDAGLVLHTPTDSVVLVAPSAKKNKFDQSHNLQINNV